MTAKRRNELRPLSRRGEVKGGGDVKVRNGFFGFASE